MLNKLISINLPNHFRFSMMLSQLQKIKGICSTVENEPNKHYIFWEFDNVKIEDLIIELNYQQQYNNLGNIYIVSDKENSYRAFCFSKKTFKEMFNILLNTQYIDFMFLWWTFNRCKATLRTHNKVNRKPQKLLFILQGKEQTEIPNKYLGVIYETGTTKIKTKIVNKYAKKVMRTM